jgi:hypothetical protein
MVIQQEPKKAISRRGKARLTIARRETVLVEMRKLLPVMLPAEKGLLMPPTDEFNTGYLKPKKNDPL